MNMLRTILSNVRTIMNYIDEAEEAYKEATRREVDFLTLRNHEKKIVTYCNSTNPELVE